MLAVTAITARSVALAGFGLDSLIEIGASTVVIWELSDTGQARQRRALRLIGAAFALLAVYLAVQSTLVLVTGYHPQPSMGGIVWTAVTAVVMFALAVGKARTGAALDNPVLRTEGRVTLVDGLLAVAVLAGLVLNAALGWWWADPVAGYVLLAYAPARSTRSSSASSTDRRASAHPPCCGTRSRSFVAEFRGQGLLAAAAHLAADFGYGLADSPAARYRAFRLIR